MVLRYRMQLGKPSPCGWNGGLDSPTWGSANERTPGMLVWFCLQSLSFESASTITDHLLYVGVFHAHVVLFFLEAGYRMSNKTIQDHLRNKSSTELKISVGRPNFGMNARQASNVDADSFQVGCWPLWA